MYGGARNIRGRKSHIFGPARQYPACRATTFYEVYMGFQATEVSGAPPALEPNDVAARAPLERFSEGQSDWKLFSFSSRQDKVVGQCCYFRGALFFARSFFFAGGF